MRFICAQHERKQYLGQAYLFLHHLPQLRIHLHQDNHYASYLHHFHHLHLRIFQLELDHHLPVCQNRKFNISTPTLQ